MIVLKVCVWFYNCYNFTLPRTVKTSVVSREFDRNIKFVIGLVSGDIQTRFGIPTQCCVCLPKPLHSKLNLKIVRSCSIQTLHKDDVIDVNSHD